MQLLQCPQSLLYTFVVTMKTIHYAGSGELVLPIYIPKSNVMATDLIYVK